MRHNPRHLLQKSMRGPKAAAVTVAASAVIAAPLIGMASPASATGGNHWDQIAQCESGGNWSTNTGNGYSGGLQFSPQTWKAFGGGKYGSSANQATRQQQIEVAKKVQGSQGWGAWPTCSSKAGVSGGGGAPAPQQPQQPQQQPQQQSQQQSQPQQQRQIPAGTGNYTVKSGDTLGKIAKQEDVRGGWHEIFNANHGVIQDPALIFPGQKLQVP